MFVGDRWAKAQVYVVYERIYKAILTTVKDEENNNYAFTGLVNLRGNLNDTYFYTNLPDIENLGRLKMKAAHLLTSACGENANQTFGFPRLSCVWSRVAKQYKLVPVFVYNSVAG